MTPQERADAVTFTIAECIRIQKLTAEAIATKNFSLLDQDDRFCSLPHPSGNGEADCGRAAYQRLHKVAALALRESPFAERAELNDVFKAFRQHVSERFLTGAQAVDPDTVSAAVADAITEAAAKCLDRTHLIPCRLMRERKPEEFSIGPVIFRQIDKTNTVLESAYAAYVASAKSDSDKEWLPKILEEARAYYGEFTWCAEVKIVGCAPEVSKARAFIAVETAVNFLRLLFGHNHTDRMAVGGPRLASDRRAHMHIDENGSLDVSSSWNTTSAGTFGETWFEIFDRDDAKFMTEGAVRMLAPVVDPSLELPLASRLVDALKWYGEAVREETPASRIVKAVTSIERLVMTGDKHKITDTIAKRSAFLLCGTGLETDFYSTVSKMKGYYDLRSGLAHGRLSPFDPTVEENARGCVRFAERVLSSGLVFLHSYNLLTQALTPKQLGDGYKILVDQMEKAVAAGIPILPAASTP